MQIREYQTQDEAAVIALWQACNLLTPSNDPHKDIARKLAHGRDLFLVGTDNNDSIIATAMGGYEGHRGWVNYLAVAPSAQGNGYGKAIMTALEQRLIQKGCPKINLQIRQSNSAALGFYTALGYGDDEVIGLGKGLIND